jgi:sensor histidine kinase YesM
MENSYHDDPSVKKGSFNSSKGARGGIGLESVKAVLDLYQGCLNCERQDNTFIFSAVLNLES